MQELGLDQARAWCGWQLMMFWLALSFALSLLFVGVLRRYLLRAQMLDHPGQRRLHRAPVARGGGLALAAVAATIMLLASLLAANKDLLLLNAGLILVSAIGWCDDRRDLGIATRLLVHALAGLSVWWMLYQLGLFNSNDGVAISIGIALIVICVAASINLHNFIDGANGMLGLQSIFVLAVLIACSSSSDWGLQIALFSTAGAVLGFLPWNFPVARVFLGDVGSGALGYLLAALTLWACALGRLSIVEALLLHSLVLIDTLSTLCYRIFAGRRWWRAHREHFYQWLIRSGRSHLHVVMLLQLWNILLVLPLIIWSRAHRDRTVELDGFNVGLDEPVLAWIGAAVFVGGISLRWLGKRRLLDRHRAKYRNARKTP